MNKTFRLVLILNILCVFWGAPLVQAASNYGVSFSDEIEMEGKKLDFIGAGPKSYLFIRVFVAGFYLGQGIDPGQVLKDVPKKLEVHYFFKVPARQLAVETRRRIMLNLSAQEFEEIRARVDEMDGYFVNLAPGDVYALSYLPGRGTQFLFNGRVIGTIAGSDFAKGLFSVWFGDRPLDESLKIRLLGKYK